mgnify:CR=1 FL=1
MRGQFMIPDSKVPHAIAFSAPHKQAADIGLAVLREGGSAVDAMIAAAAAIAGLTKCVRPPLP